MIELIMIPMYEYCEWACSHDIDPWNREYHDHAYGFPLVSDNELFGRLLLEINQAGLSWLTILKKQDNFRHAYSNFDIGKVAAYDLDDRIRLLADAGIIRNRLKVNAAIENANRILMLQKEHGSFRQWLESHRGLELPEWTKLFKKTFLFTGGEIVNEFLMSTGYVPGAHSPHCEAGMRAAALSAHSSSVSRT